MSEERDPLQKLKEFAEKISEFFSSDQQPAEAETAPTTISNDPPVAEAAPPAEAPPAATPPIVQEPARSVVPQPAEAIPTGDPLTAVVDGLLFSSEADYPLEPFTWSEAKPFAPELLYKVAGLTESTSVTQVALAEFLAPMLHAPEKASEATLQRVARYQQLLQVLQQTLSDIQVYKLGEVEMPTFILGKRADGSIAGLRTTVVET